MIEESDKDKPTCYHPNCNSPGEFYTYPDDYDDDPNTDLHLTHCYCPTHAGQYGFCIGCGGFWGGVESFEFAYPKIKVKLCSDCMAEFKGDCPEFFDDYSDDDEDYYY